MIDCQDGTFLHILWNNVEITTCIDKTCILMFLLLILLTPNTDSSKSLKPWNFSNSMASIHSFKAVSMIFLLLQLILSLHSQFSLCCKHTQYTYCWVFLFCFVETGPHYVAKDWMELSITPGWPPNWKTHLPLNRKFIL